MKKNNNDLKPQLMKNMPAKKLPFIPEIVSPSVNLQDHPSYTQAVKNILYSIFPQVSTEREFKEQLENLLPLVVWSEFKDPPFILSVFLFCKFRPNVYRFFYNMVSRWLIPGKSSNVPLQFALDFSFPELSDQVFVAGEVVVAIEGEGDLKVLMKNLPTIETEIRLGVDSAYHANRILEIKGYTSDEKTALIQENIASLVRHRPQDFDYDVFQEMQHFLVLCKEEFKNMRPYRHMSRIICVHYLFRKALALSYESFPSRRYVSVKLIRARLRTLEGERVVIGIAIGLSFLKENECFDERHILKGVSMVFPGIKGVKGSFFQNARRTDPTCTYYLEIEKLDKTLFTLEEFKRLKEELPEALNRSVEKRENPLFMPQNEEEIMRNVVRLSKEVDFVHDIPQVMISYRAQTETELEFLVLLVRVVKETPLSLQELFASTPTFLAFIPNRSKKVGHLKQDRNYKKEANIFSLRLKKGKYLRHDHSVDLYNARQDLAAELHQVIGEFRDYNGGMLSKEKEVFSSLVKAFPSLSRRHKPLLENFFHSLAPPAMRSLMPAPLLKKLFSLMLDTVREGPALSHGVLFRIEDGEALFIVLVGQEEGFKKVVERAIENLSLSSSQLATTFLQVNASPCMGVLYRAKNKKQAQALRLAIEDAISAYEKSQQKKQHLVEQ